MTRVPESRESRVDWGIVLRPPDVMRNWVMNSAVRDKCGAVGGIESFLRFLLAPSPQISAEGSPYSFDSHLPYAIKLVYSCFGASVYYVC